MNNTISKIFIFLLINILTGSTLLAQIDEKKMFPISVISERLDNNGKYCFNGCGYTYEEGTLWKGADTSGIRLVLFKFGYKLKYIYPSSFLYKDSIVYFNGKMEQDTVSVLEISVLKGKEKNRGMYGLKVKGIDKIKQDSQIRFFSSMLPNELDYGVPFIGGDYPIMGNGIFDKDDFKYLKRGDEIIVYLKITKQGEFTDFSVSPNSHKRYQKTLQNVITSMKDWELEGKRKGYRKTIALDNYRRPTSVFVAIKICK